MPLTQSENVGAITKWFKDNVPEELPVVPLNRLIDGNVSINVKKKTLRLTIVLPLDDIMEQPHDLRKFLNNDLKLIPIVVFADGETLAKSKD